MKKSITIVFLLSVFLLTGCNAGAKNFGGTIELDLPENKKLVNVTWKDNSLWYLTKNMTKEDKAETYEFVEKSNLGFKSGKVIIHEHKNRQP